MPHSAHKGNWKYINYYKQNLSWKMRLICRVTQIKQSDDRTKTQGKITEWAQIGNAIKNKRNAGRRRKEGEQEDTWEYSRVATEPYCSWLGCGTHYWCSRKFALTGNEAASCLTPTTHTRTPLLWHYLRRMANSGIVSYHPSCPLACQEEIWSHCGHGHVHMYT